MKKIFTFAAAAFITLAQLAYAAEPSLKLSGGTGTSDDPYKISKAADLVELANACNGASGAVSGHYKDAYFEFTADIDMTGVEDFMGIATAPFASASGTSWYFAGKVDGKGHKISNMKIKGMKFDENGKAMAAGANKSRKYIALFGYVQNTFSLKNLTLDASCQIEGYDYVAGFVGYSQSSAYTGNIKYQIELENLTNLASIDCYNNYAGGILGYGSGTTNTTVGFLPISFKNCVNGGKIRVMNNTAAGITGYTAYGSFENCANYGEVHAYTWNEYVPKSKGYNVAGINGNGQYCQYTNVINYGTIWAENENGTADATFSIGGICKTISGNASVKAFMKNVVNLGQLVYPQKYNANVGMITGQTYTGVTANFFPEYENVYYDAQVWGSKAALGKPYEGITGANTAYLTSGNLPQGLDAEFWSASKGFYPTLKLVSNDFIKAVSATYILFDNDEQSASGFIGTIKPSTAMSGITLSTSTEGFVINNNVLSVASSVTGPLSGSVTVTNGEYVMPVNVSYIPKLWEGEGTEQKPYLVKTANDLVNLANVTNDPVIRLHYENTFFKQTADIDMASVKDFQGIASRWTGETGTNNLYYFSGTYDGGGFAIKNLDISRVSIVDGKYATNVAKGMQNYVGLFGALYKGGCLKNITLDASCKVSAANYTGSVVGYLFDKTTVSNCSSAATVFASDGYAGGIAGFSEVASGPDVTQLIENCVFTGSVTACYQNIGGIIGWNKGEVKNCANFGALTLLKDQYTNDARTLVQLYHAGGITGYNYGNVRNCLNAATVIAPGGRAAGIVGENAITNKKGQITGCVNYGVVISSEDNSTNGAIVGKNNGKFVSSANYYDAQLTELPAASSSTATVDYGFHGLTTSQFTSGEKLDSIADGLLSYRKGYYPVPAAIAQLPIVKEASEMYFVLPEGVNVTDITKDGVLSTVMKDVTPALEVAGSGFELKEGKLIPLPVNEKTANTLTFTGKYITRPYFIQRITPGLSKLDDLEIDMDSDAPAEYYNIQGMRVAQPRSGNIYILKKGSTTRKIYIK